MPRLVLLFLLALAFVQCAREVIIDLPEEPTRAVVVGHFTPGEPFRIKIMLSQAVHESGPPVVPQAGEVLLWANGEDIDKLRLVSDPITGSVYWESMVLPITGVQYKLKVHLAEAPGVEASSAVPAYIGLEPVTVAADSVLTEDLPNGQRRLRVPLRLSVAELPPADRFFAFKFRHQINVYSDSAHQQLDDVQVPANTPFSTDGRTFALLHDLDEPVVLINEKYWTDDRHDLRLDVLIPFEPPYQVPTRLFIEWRTLSPEFYRYHLSLARQSSAPPLTDPDAVFNNVDGGYGNFSGYSVRVDTVALPN